MDRNKASDHCKCKTCRRFVWEYVVCRFGVPQIISSKDDTHFKEGIFIDLCRGLKITQSFSPITEHIEIMSRIKKQLARSQQGWVDDLPQVLWVHKKLPRNNQKETPFSLTYGSEAIILTVKSIVAKDGRGRMKEVKKRKEIKEVTSIEKGLLSKQAMKVSQQKEQSFQLQGRRFRSAIVKQHRKPADDWGFATEASAGGDIRLESGAEDGVAL
ncbi:reverse transcriptase domain-containing protein [Tanacetum coccineum]